MNSDEKICPRCAETVKRAALVCRYCGHEFEAATAPSTWLPPGAPPDKPKKPALSQRQSNGALGCLGLVVALVLIGQCSSDSTNTTAVESTNAAKPFDAFDNLSSMVNEPAKPASDWRAHTQTDELRGKPVYYAAVTSENSVEFEFPYGGGANLTMTVRRHPKYGDDVIFQISTGQFVCGIDSCRGTINYGSGPVSVSLVEPEDHSSDTLFASGASGVIAKLKKSDRVIVELPFYQEGNRQFTFKTKGLAWPPTTG